MVFHCIFLGEKAIIITSKHGTRNFFPITILFYKENSKKKCPEKRSKIQTKCAHAPWASYNTPQIELIQYGRRIGKKVYYWMRGLWFPEKSNTVVQNRFDLIFLSKIMLWEDSARWLEHHRKNCLNAEVHATRKYNWLFPKTSYFFFFLVHILSLHEHCYKARASARL